MIDQNVVIFIGITNLSIFYMFTKANNKTGTNLFTMNKFVPVSFYFTSVLLPFSPHFLNPPHLPRSHTINNITHFNRLSPMCDNGQCLLPWKDLIDSIITIYVPLSKAYVASPNTKIQDRVLLSYHICQFNQISMEARQIKPR